MHRDHFCCQNPPVRRQVKRDHSARHRKRETEVTVFNKHCIKCVSGGKIDVIWIGWKLMRFICSLFATHDQGVYVMNDFD